MKSEYHSVWTKHVVSHLGWQPLLEITEMADPKLVHADPTWVLLRMGYI